MTPIEIDAICQLPVLFRLRATDAKDVEGTVAGGGINTLTVATMKPDWSGDSIVGCKVDLWIGRGADQVEIQREIVGFDPAGGIITVSEPWSQEFPEIGKTVPLTQFGDKWRVVPLAGDVYRIEVAEMIELPRLGCDGLIPWLEEITEKRVADRLEAMSTTKMTPKDVASAKADLRLGSEAVMSDLTIPVQTPAGMRKIVAASLDMSTVDKSRRATILAHIMADPAQAWAISRKLCGLFGEYERRPAPKPDIIAEAKAAFPGAKIKAAKEDEGPLAGSGENPPTQNDAS